VCNSGKMARRFCALTLAWLTGQLWAQAPVQFEVASVKMNKSGSGVRGGCHGIDSKYSPSEAASAPPLGRCIITAGRLSHLIGIAYGLQSMELIVGGPDWVVRGFDRFDVEAKAEDGSHTTEAQLRAMLGALLVERFDLKYHRENVDRPGFALVIGKNGPKLKRAKGEDTTTSFGGQFKPVASRPVALTARKYSIVRLATLLSQLGPAPIIDKTGLDGEYDFTLDWDEDQGPTLAVALQEQLGLRLEPQKVPVSRFVIESARKPSPN
jgi:uncharacterized protein (TIGR03435 family)